MKKISLWIVLVLFVIFFILPGVVQAHGQPVITVQPLVASAGSKITVNGSDMEPGEVFSISLEGIGGSIPLGNATVIGEGEEGGFEEAYTVPENTPPGSYVVRAVTSQGEEKAETDLTITSPTAQANPGPATVQEPSGEQHQLDRSKPIMEVIGVGVIALVSGLIGLWLVLGRST